MTIIRAENADDIYLFIRKILTKYIYSSEKRRLNTIIRAKNANKNRLLGINMLNLVKSIFLKELYKVSWKEVIYGKKNAK